MRERRTRTIHRCNGVVDPATCCPRAHNKSTKCDNRGGCLVIREEKCDLNHWHEIPKDEKVEALRASAIEDEIKELYGECATLN